jgi:ubiquitin-conjugating enzyme E2 O
MLDSDFPHSPPIAHFLSWTNGNGRGVYCWYLLLCLHPSHLTFHSKPVGLVTVGSSRSVSYSPLHFSSRNLYEEGKVCLSILGTWAGDRNESWSPSRSSLLQALVSIQGLVLVKEPYVPNPLAQMHLFFSFCSDSIPEWWGD